MLSLRENNILVSFSLMIALMISLVAMVGLANSSAIQKKQVTLTAILAAPKDRWDILLTGAVQKLKERHPNIDIKVDYKVLPYNVSRGQMIMALNNQTPIDLISVDQIWLGDFAQRGYITNLTGFVKSWGRASDWYQTNLDGGVYNGKVYGIWAWTDVRGMWYWKDLLSNAGVDPNSLQTWDGYISSLKKINNAYKEQGIKGGFALCGATEWYPYLWMLGGNILIMKDGHPTKGTYWFPTYNSSAGVKAAQFLKSEIAAGMKPILSNISGFERDFIDRKVAVLMGGSWLPEFFPAAERKDLEQTVGFMPMYPVPSKGSITTTVLGGWELGIPQTSKNKELAWELITIMVQPDILASMLAQTGYLPTQKNIGAGQESITLNQTIPYYNRMVSMIPIGHSRPIAPEYPQIDNQISVALDQVCSGLKEPKQALEDAATMTAKVLGW